MVKSLHNKQLNTFSTSRFKSNIKSKFIIVSLFLIFIQHFAFTQNLWEDKATLDSFKSGIQCAYNFEFDKAECIRDTVNAKYPNHPAGLMYEAIILYWKYYPVQAETEMGNKYESLLLKSLVESELLLSENPMHPLTNFFDMIPRMMLLQFYADNGQGLKSIPHLTKAYGAIINGFNLCEITPEFYFTTGLYDYYIEAYPEANPFYKPFVYFFPNGNKEEGLKELYKCWQQSEYIGSEALTFLTYIYINFETNYAEGLKYAYELSQSYPQNPLFAQYYIQLLLLNKQYNKAEIIVKQFKENKNNNFFRDIFSVFDAIIIEHLHSDYSKAEALYNLSLDSMIPYGSYAKRYMSYAYFGLSRIYETKGLVEESLQFKSKAEKVAQYPQVNFD